VSSSAKKIKFYLYHEGQEKFSELSDGLVCGRNEGDFQFPGDKLMSRRHCRLRIQGNEVYVEDLGATNRTRVNGVPVRPEKRRRVLLNDVIDVGSQRLILTSQKDKPPAHILDSSPSTFYLALRRADGTLTRFITKLITKQTLVRVNRRQFKRLQAQGFWSTYGKWIVFLLVMGACAANLAWQMGLLSS
jgi:hypothetical protein